MRSVHGGTWTIWGRPSREVPSAAIPGTASLYKPVQDTKPGKIFADHHAEIGKQENQQGARDTVLPPAAPVDYIVAQRLEIRHARTSQPHLHRRTDRPG